MALSTFFVRTGFLTGLGQFFMAALAIAMIGVLEFWNFTLFLEGVMALLARFYWVTLFPHILTILVIMVAFGAGDAIVLLVLFVAEVYRTLYVTFVSGILDTNSLGALISRTQHPTKQEGDR